MSNNQHDTTSVDPTPPPWRPKVTELPGNYIAMQPPRIPLAQQPLDLSSPAAIGAALGACGVDGITAGQVVANIQAILAQTTNAIAHQLLTAISHAQAARSAALSTAVRSLPAVDAFGARAVVAAAVADPTLLVMPDPTPR